MRWMSALERSLGKALQAMVALFFFGILCLTVTLVLLRYGFNSSIIWGSEAMNYLFIYTTAIGAAAAIGSETHIKISCLRDLAKGRVRKAVDLLAYLLVFTVNAVMCWCSLPWIFAVGTFESPVMRIPMWVVQAAIPVGCSLACLFCLLHMIRIVLGDTGEEVGEAC